MNYRQWPRITHAKPICFGTGLVVLDVVVNGNPGSSSRLWAGGSCGNVLTILSYFGWESYPIARLGRDAAAQELLQDLRKWGVKTPLMSNDSPGHTPIIIEKLGTSPNGIPSHRFELVCPNCRAWLPRYVPVLARAVEVIAERMSNPQVFYFDRVSRSSVELAKISKERGALVIFEPSAVTNDKLFFECLQVTDILKYSNQRLRHIELPTQDVRVPLEIETLGAKGLRYRLARKGDLITDWKLLNAFPVNNFRDAAGSGDWCSAGLIHLMGRDGHRGFELAKAEEIQYALSFGQALAALNCYYDGPRGSMYSISKREFMATTIAILNDANPSELIKKSQMCSSPRDIADFCPRCLESNIRKLMGEDLPHDSVSHAKLINAVTRI